MRKSKFIIPKDRLAPVNQLKVVTGDGKLRLPSVPLNPAVKTGEDDTGRAATSVSRSGGRATEAPVAAPVKNRLLSFYSKRYQLRQEITGGQAIVYRAWDRDLEMDVVLKFLPAHVMRSKESVAELKREAAVAMRLTHENIVRLHNVDFENAKPFMVMEFIDGETLRRILLRVGAISPGTVIRVATASVGALAYAHGHGILHRDIKPENIMVAKDGVLKVLDFGSAVGVESGPGKYIEGTPGYMAPEQVDGLMVDVRADVFGLGSVLWELLTGRPAFPERKDLWHMYDKTPDSGGKIEAGVEAVLLKAMHRDPARRWSTVVEFGEALTAAGEKVL